MSRFAELAKMFRTESERDNLESLDAIERQAADELFPLWNRIEWYEFGIHVSKVQPKFSQSPSQWWRVFCHAVGDHGVVRNANSQMFDYGKPEAKAWGTAGVYVCLWLDGVFSTTPIERLIKEVKALCNQQRKLQFCWNMAVL